MVRIFSSNALFGFLGEGVRNDPLDIFKGTDVRGAAFSGCDQTRRSWVTGCSLLRGVKSRRLIPAVTDQVTDDAVIFVIDPVEQVLDRPLESLRQLQETRDRR